MSGAGLGPPEDARPESPTEALLDYRSVPPLKAGRLLRPTIIVTVCGLGVQILAAAVQIVTAALFGTRGEMDALLAATTLPQYVTAVVVSSLTFVSVPFFVDRAAKGGNEAAWRAAGGMIQLTVIVLAIVAAMGAIFAGPLVRLLAPGLPAETSALAARASLLIWPAIVAQAVVTLVTGIYQARSSFSWPAVVPLVGTSVNLIVLTVGARKFGIYAAAGAVSLGVIVQMVLVAPMLRRNVGHWDVRSWRDPHVRQWALLLMPIVLSSVIVRCTPVLERYLASQLPPSTISHLSYAFRLVGIFSLLLATGLATVVFPRMARSASESNLDEMAQTASLAARYMLLAVAPAIVLIMVLAEPLTIVLLRRGRFTDADAAAVSTLVRVYAFSILPSTLGAITGRMFYVLRSTRILGIAAVLEAIVYVGSAAWLSRLFGAAGVAAAYALYYNGSLLWQVLLIRRKTVPGGGARIVRSAGRTSIAAVATAAVAWSASASVHSAYLKLCAGGLAGTVAYVLVLMAMRSEEARDLLYLVKNSVQSRRSPSPGNWN